MKSYIESIGYFMVLAALVQMLVPDKFRRDIGFLLGMVLMLVICRPLEGLISKPVSIEMPEGQEDTAKYDAIRERMLSDGMKAELERVVAEQTGAERVEVEIDEGNNIRRAVLYGEVKDDARKTAAELCGVAEDQVAVQLW